MSQRINITPIGAPNASVNNDCVAATDENSMLSNSNSILDEVGNNS